MLVRTTTQHVIPGRVQGETSNRTVVYSEGVFAGLPVDIPDTEMGVRGGGDDCFLVRVSDHVCNLLRVTWPGWIVFDRGFGCMVADDLLLADY